MMTMIWNLTTGPDGRRACVLPGSPSWSPATHEHRGQRGAGRGAQRLLTHHRLGPANPQEAPLTSIGETGHMHDARRWP